VHGFLWFFSADPNLTGNLETTAELKSTFVVAARFCENNKTALAEAGLIIGTRILLSIKQPPLRKVRDLADAAASVIANTSFASYTLLGAVLI